MLPGKAVWQDTPARAKEGRKQRDHATARSSWSIGRPSITPDLYSQMIQPLLAKLSNSAIASAIGFRAGTQGASAKAIAHTRGIGRRSRNSRVFKPGRTTRRHSQPPFGSLFQIQNKRESTRTDVSCG